MSQKRWGGEGRDYFKAKLKYKFLFSFSVISDVALKIWEQQGHSEQVLPCIYCFVGKELLGDI